MHLWRMNFLRVGPRGPDSYHNFLVTKWEEGGSIRHEAMNEHGPQGTRLG